MSRLAIPIGVACTFFACADPARAETRSLVEAVARYHVAPEQEQRARAEDIAKVACAAADVCAARDTCVDAAKLMDRSRDMLAMVKVGLSAVESGAWEKESPEARALPVLLDESERTLKESRTKLKACDDALLLLADKHK
jgi:hypothetical protein